MEKEMLDKLEKLILTADVDQLIEIMGRIDKFVAEHHKRVSEEGTEEEQIFLLQLTTLLEGLARVRFYNLIGHK